MRTTWLALLLLLPACTDTGGTDDPFVRGSAPGTEPCVQGEAPSLFKAEASLADATRWICSQRVPVDQAPAISFVSGVTTLVNGGTTLLSVHLAEPTDVSGLNFLVDVEGEGAHFLTRLSNKTEDSAELELYIANDADPGPYTVRVAFDTGAGTPEEPAIGPWFEFPIAILGVAGGNPDIQVAVSWSTERGTEIPTDVDLFVVDPAGDTVWWNGEPVASGGMLDLDSNAGCEPGDFNENVFWPEGTAPPGEYVVRLNYWSDCDSGLDSDWRLTLLLRGEVAEIHEGTFTSGDLYQGGVEAGAVVTTFTLP